MNYRRYLEVAKLLLPNKIWLQIKRYPNDQIPSFLKNVDEVPQLLNKELQYTKDRRHTHCNVLVNTEDYGLILQYMKSKSMKFKVEVNNNFDNISDSLLEQIQGPETKDSPNFKHRN